MLNIIKRVEIVKIYPQNRKFACWFIPRKDFSQQPHPSPNHTLFYVILLGIHPRKMAQHVVINTRQASVSCFHSDITVEMMEWEPPAEAPVTRELNPGLHGSGIEKLVYLVLF